jgi:Flp pilus assembly protein CpaB
MREEAPWMQRKASLLALAISLVAALMLLWLIGDGPLGATRPVVVVTRDLAPGEALTRPVLDFRDLPEAFVEERHIPAEALERALAMRVTTSLTSGATLLWTDLEAAHAPQLGASLVQVGMRALALRELGEEAGVHAGDRVDVLFTPRVPEDGSPDEQASVAVLENALVLASEPRAVTLSVTPRDALRVVHTQGRGALRVTLRNPHDMAMAEVFEDTQP